MPEQDYQALQHEIDELRNDLKALLETVKGDSAKHRLEEAKIRLLNVAHGLEGRAKQRFISAYDTVRNTSEKAVDTSRANIMSHPIAFVLGAFGVGMLIGNLMMRGRRS